MANRLRPLAGLCALYLVCVGCSSDSEPEASSGAGSPTALAGAPPASGGTTSTGEGSRSGTAAAGAPPASAGASASGGTAGGAGKPSGGGDVGAPAAVEGRSVYALECHGDSKDCNLAAVPCFGVGSPTPNVAAGWACANRCSSNADCSDAPSGAEAEASCVAFSSAKHCVLVCKNEDQSFACPDGMTCYVPAKSPIGYCLWP